MISKDFEKTFSQWVDASLKNLPETVRGVAFNLFEYARTDNTQPRYGVELVGAPVFTKDDSDWVCDEVFEAQPRSLIIPLSYSGSNWEACLRVMITLVKIIYIRLRQELYCSI